jgi:hypothetical protein
MTSNSTSIRWSRHSTALYLQIYIIIIIIIIILNLYTDSWCFHIFIFFSTPLCRPFPSPILLSHSCCNLPTSTNFEVFPFFVFQMGTIPKFFKGAFLSPLFPRGKTSSITIIIVNIMHAARMGNSRSAFKVLQGRDH